MKKKKVLKNDVESVENEILLQELNKADTGFHFQSLKGLFKGGIMTGAKVLGSGKTAASVKKIFAND